MWIFLSLAAVLIVTVSLALFVDAGRTARREEADELEATRLRLVAAGEVIDAPVVGGTVYTSAAALDTRIVELTVDPTLTEADIVTAVEHVAPGVGSLASFATATYDTGQMRTGAERKELGAAYDAAHDENTERDLNAAVAAVWAAADDVWATIDAWVERYHGEEHYADCIHCTEALREISDEHRHIVSAVDTGEISKADIEALYALPGATT